MYHSILITIKMLLQLLFLKEEMGFQSRDVTKAGSDKAGTSSHLLLLLQPSCIAYLLQKRKEGISRVENKTPGTVGRWRHT